MSETPWRDYVAMKEEEAAKQARAELRDRFAMAALAKLVGDAVPNPVSAKEAWEWADMMLATRDWGAS